MPVVVNDVHSRLNQSRPRSIATPRSLAEAIAIVRLAVRRGETMAIAGARHAMGGQQFAAGALLLDTTGLDRVIAFDRQRGLVEVEAGIRWPALHAALVRAQPGDGNRWTFRQKQTGADNFTLGGSLSANIHGRGLAMPPLVEDIEAFTLIDASGEVHRCSREENPERFALGVGGYGLFGVVLTVTLRLARRQHVERVVQLCDAASLLPLLEGRIAEGYLYGDFQFAIDASDDGFLDRGIVSCYRPVAGDGPLPRAQRSLSEHEWQRLLWLAHRDKQAAFDAFASFYLSTSGQRYGSDDHQLGYYLDGYHLSLDERLGHRGSEVIGELYVPRAKLVDFLRGAAGDLRRHHVDVVYGTVRLIECDTQTFLPWARDAYACVVLNLHTPHDREGIARTSRAFRRLIDLAAALGGSFYLTYHRCASRAQLEACHPRFEPFLARKRQLDPRGVFDSDWHRHYSRLFDAPSRERRLSAVRTS